MDPAVRKLIDQPWPDRRRYEEIGALLPADDTELDRWFAELVETMDPIRFTILAVAAVGANRPVDGRHLVQGAGLVTDPTILICLAWHMTGEVAPPLLAATSDERVIPVHRCMALFALAAICQERLGAIYPPELITRARILSRSKHRMHEIGIKALLGIAGITRDPALAAILEINNDERWETVAKIARDLTETCRKSPLELVYATPARKLGGMGETVRRAVARIGRNEPCPCQSGRKYKNCCMAADAERLQTSSSVAGKSLAELRAEPEPHLTPDRIIHSAPPDLVRFDPHKIPPALRKDFLFRLFDHGLDDRLIECFQLLGFPEEFDELCKNILFYAMNDGRTEVIRRLLTAHPRSASLQEYAPLGIHLALAEDDPARYLALIQERSLEALREIEEGPIYHFACSLLSSKLSAIGIFVARALIPGLGEKFAQRVLDQLVIARDKLGLSPDDPAGDLLEKRLLEETRAGAADDSKESRALAEARERLDAKAREVAFLRKTMETLRHDVKRRESRPPSNPAPATTGPVADEGALKELRFKVQKLKGELKERHEERITLRQELREAHARLDDGDRDASAHGAGSDTAGVGRHGRAQAEADAEAEHLLPEETTEIQPVRLPEFPRKFQETLQGLPRHVARNAVATIGRLAAGELAAFGGVLRLKACPETYRQRIGANHRLLFRVTPDRLVVVDLINRRDLDRRIKSLIATG